MKENSIYWKTASKQNAVSIYLALRDKYLIIQKVKRIKKKITILEQFDSGMQFSNEMAMIKATNFINDLPEFSANEFIIIRSV